MKKFNLNNLHYLWTRSLEVIKKNGLKTFIKKIFNFIFFSNKIDLDALEIRKDSTLDDFFIKFGSDKGSVDSKKTYDTLYKNSNEQKFKNYLDWINRKNPNDYDYQLGLDSAAIYNKFFSTRRMDKLKILEIGVANGHSIASWHHYFPNSNIYGIDNKKPYKFFYKSKRVKYFEIDIFDKKKIKSFIEQHGRFDFIIDDSLHEAHAMLTNIINFYPALKPNGSYFLEDFRSIDNAKEAIVNYNLKHNKKLFGESPLSIKDIFTNINDKKLFNHKMIDKKSLEYIFKTTKNTEIIYQDHPWAAIAILHKNEND